MCVCVCEIGPRVLEIVFSELLLCMSANEELDDIFWMLLPGHSKPTHNRIHFICMHKIDSIESSVCQRVCYV